MHAVVTDPPYNLSDSGKRDIECMSKIIADVLLPKDNKGNSKEFHCDNLAHPSLFGSPLRGEHRPFRENARVRVPESAIHLKRTPVVEHEVDAGDKLPVVSAYGVLSDKADIPTLKLDGNFILQRADRRDATFCDRTCSCFTKPSFGFISVSVVVLQLSGSNATGAGLKVGGRDQDVWNGHESGSQAESPAGVHASWGAIHRTVLRLDLGRGTGELDFAHRASDRLPTFKFASTESVTAGARARRLAAEAKPYRVRLVSGEANGTFTLYQLGHAPKSTESLMSKDWDGWASPCGVSAMVFWSGRPTLCGC